VAGEDQVAVDDDPAQGWCVDPYGVHEDRWISRGRPSDLVRDGGIEAKDPPPNGPPNRPFVKSHPGPVPTTEAALKERRYSGTRVRLAQGRPAPRWYPVGFSLLALVGVLLVGVGITATAPPNQTQGTVVSVISSLADKGAVLQRQDVDVSYSVPGRGNFTLTVTHNPLVGPSEAGVGSPIMVSYDPDDPSKAHLVATGFWTGTAGGFGVFVGGAALVLALVWAFRWWRYRAPDVTGA
jgi:hypothetical protein